MHIYDNDKAEYQAYVAQINGEGNPLKKAFNTSMMEMENFLCKEAVEEAYAANGLVVTLLEIQHDTDVPIMVCRAFNPDWDLLDEDKKAKKEAKVEKLLNI